MSLPRFVARRHVRVLAPRIVLAGARAVPTAAALKAPVAVPTMPVLLKDAAVPAFLARTRLTLIPPVLRASPLWAAARTRMLPSTGTPATPRFATYGSEYHPSQRKRKRKHGFLARLKSRTGRKILIRRRLIGRARISH